MKFFENIRSYLTTAFIILVCSVSQTQVFIPFGYWASNSTNILDVVPGAVGGYSLRLIRSGYTGSAIQLRRSTDNVTQDIGFDSNGNLDTSTASNFLGVSIPNSSLNPLDTIPVTASAAYSTRKLNSSYSGSALQVRRSNDSSTQDIGFDGSGNLDITALTTFLSSGGTTAYSPYPLEQARVGAKGAYSFRKLYSGYIGKAIQLRRGSDNATQDIGFSSTGDLSSADITDFTGLLVTNSTLNPVDSLSNAPVASYGVRKLRSVYAGAALRVRRSIDNSEQDIGFDGSGNIDSTGLNTFLSSSDSATALYPADKTQISPKAMFSLRKLRSAYSGAAINVRRSSDNATKDIGFDANGNFDINAYNQFVNYGYAVDEVSVAPALALSLRKVKSSYSGSAIKARRATDNGTLDIGFDTSNNFNSTAFQNFVNAGAISYTAGYIAVSPSTTSIPISGVTGITSIANLAGRMNGAWLAVPILIQGTDSTTITSGQNAIVAIYDGTYTKMAQLQFTFSGANVTVSEVAAKYKSGNYLSNLTFAWANPDATAPTGSSGYGVDQLSFTVITTGGTGFVDTWYDQSGNGRNATQATLANQPEVSNPNGKWSVLGRGSQYLTSTATVAQMTNAGVDGAAIIVARPQATSGTLFGWANASSCNDRWEGHVIWNDNTLYFDPANATTARSSVAASTIANTWTQITLNRVTTTSQIRWNGVVKNTNSTASGSASTTGNWSILTTTNFASCSMVPQTVDLSEYIQYASGLSAANIAIIERSQGAYYGVAINGTVPAADSGYVTKWYDQSGNTNDISQVTLANQPTFVVSGINSKPSVQFGTTSSLSTAANVTFTGATTTNAVAKGSTSGSWGMLFGQIFSPSAGSLGRAYNSTNGWGDGYGGYNGTSSYFSANAASSTFPSASAFIATGLYNPGANTSISYYENGALRFSNTTALTAVSSAAKIQMGGFWQGGSNASYYFSGMISEAMMLDSSWQNSQQVYFESNQGGYYGISVPSSPSLGYVSKWYDQSGNTNDLVQATAANQPTFVLSGINSKPAALFGTTSSLSTAANVTFSAATTTNAVAKGSTSGAWGMLFGQIYTPSAGALGRINGSGGVGWGDGYGGHNATVTYFGATAASATFPSAGAFIASGLYNPGSTPSTAYYENGTLRFSDSTALTAVSSSSKIQMGGFWQGGSNASYYFSGMISEAIMSDLIQTDQRKYLESNQGIYYNISTSVTAPTLAYVSKWYDQSGNNLNLLQPISSKQPLLDTDTKTGLKTIQFNALSGTELDANFTGNVQTANAVYSVNGTFSGGSYPSLGGWDSTKRLFTHFSNMTTPYSDVSDLPNTSITINGFNPATSNYLTDLMSRTQIASSPTTLNSSYLSVGFNTLNTTSTTLNAAEITLFSGALSIANRVSLEGNQDNYYSLPTSSSAASGYVSKWYDQSGSGNDLIQATAANQPLFVVSAINSKPSVLFSTNKYLQTAANVTFTDGTTANVVSQQFGTPPANYYYNNLFGQLSSASKSNGAIAQVYDTTSGWGSGYGGYSGAAWAGAVSSVGVNTITFPTTPFIGSGVYVPGTSVTYTENGTTKKNNTTSIPAAFTTSDKIKMGGQWWSTGNDATYFYNGYISEAVMYPKSLIFAERKKIEMSQGTFYGITIGNQ